MSKSQETKDAAFLSLVELLKQVEAGETRIPALVFRIYPELNVLKEMATKARADLNTWMGV